MKVKDQSPDHIEPLSVRIKRRLFLGGVFGGLAGLTLPNLTGCKTQKTFWSSDNYPTEFLPGVQEAVIVGSGFGGAVTACRLAKKWPGSVTILERGKRYGKNDFPRSINQLSKAFWKLENDDVPRLLPLGNKESRGIFDLRSYDHMDTLIASGYGGGSLLYAAAIIEPNNPYYDENWPTDIKNEKLQPYFDIFREVMDARPIPRGPEPERELNDRFNLSKMIGEADGVPVNELNIGVFFGNDRNNPTPLGETEINQHGALQTSCTYCAECIVGCNFGAKTSLDYNYLYVAETKYNTNVRTEHAADRIMPLNASGEEDPTASGEFGYHVYSVDLQNQKTVVIKTNRVILAAGTFGSTDILLRNKEIYGSLANVSDRVGEQFSGNGDFVTFNLLTDPNTQSGEGPTLVEYMDYNLVEQPDRLGFIGQHMALPLHIVGNLLKATNPGPMMRDLLEKLISATSNEILMQVNVGLDKSDGSMSLNKDQRGLRLNWPYKNSLPLFEKILGGMKRAKEIIGAKLSFAMPTWSEPLRRNLTVHPLGGCALADSPAKGVVSAKRGEMGMVFNYQNLYVADGSMIPSALGANPSITIGALSEMIAEDITGIKPTTTL